MKTKFRIFWLVSLMFFTAGCSGFQPACFTGEEGMDENDMARLDDCHLQAGERVRITTTAGNKVVGDIKRITEDWIILAAVNNSDPALLYTPSQILRIEKSKAQGKGADTVEMPEIGEEVSLYLIDGTRIEGEILSVSDDSIVLEHVSGPDERLEIPRNEIGYMEAPPSSSSWVVPVVVLAVGALIIGGIIVGSQVSDLNDGIGSLGGK